MTKLLLALAINKSAAVLNRQLSGHGLDLTDFAILYHLAQTPKKSLKRNELANLLGLSPSGITRRLIPLEKLHIIARAENTTDARTRLATLTPAGIELQRDAQNSLIAKTENWPAIGQSTINLLQQLSL